MAPSHEDLYAAGDQTDLIGDRPQTGLAGSMTGQLYPVGGSAPDAVAVGEYPVAGVDATAADKAATSGTVTVTWTDPAVTGFTKVDILTVDANGEFVSRQEATASAETADVASLTDDAEYTFYVRLVSTAGDAVGPFGAGDAATPTAS